MTPQDAKRIRDLLNRYGWGGRIMIVTGDRHRLYTVKKQTD